MKNEDVEKLKEELRKELLEELRTQVNYEKQDNWTRVRKEYEKKFKKYDYTKRWEFTTSKGELVKREEDVHANQTIIGSIGTLLKSIYETPHIHRLQASYDDVKDFTEDIYQVLEKHKKRFLDGRRI